MEHMGGQILEKTLKDDGCIEESRARELFRQLVEAVDYAHKQVGQDNSGTNPYAALGAFKCLPRGSLHQQCCSQYVTTLQLVRCGHS